MYSQDPDWDDVVPLPQDDGDHPLAQINYSEEYAEAMAYLRALMAKDELSERALKITEHVIDLNPAHYTVWLDSSFPGGLSEKAVRNLFWVADELYRVKCLTALGADLKNELQFLNMKALKHEKNYQIWHHRQLVVNQLGDPTGEQEFIREMFEKDSKNYHVWSYRQWLVKRFDLWEKGEIEYLNTLLEDDIRNNSAWNHRFFIVFGRGTPVSEDVIEREINFVEESVFLAPQNPSPWNYLRGLMSRCNIPSDRVKKLCQHYAPLDNPVRIKSSHALDLLAEIMATEGNEKDSAKAFDLLATTFDPVRTPFWKYRKASIVA